MHAVPPEVLAAVLAWLDPWDLARACRVCRGTCAAHAAWHAVCLDEGVWAHAARDTPLDAALHSALPVFASATTLCDVQRRWHARRRAWGRTCPIPPALHPRLTVYRPPGTSASTHVERVAIEYVGHRSPSASQGIVIESTSANLRALDAATGAVLWATPAVQHEVLSRKHLGLSHGWLLQDEYIPTRAHLWRAAARGQHGAPRGQFVWQRSWAEPGRALYLSYPILAWYVRGSCSKKDDQYVETDIHTARVVRSYPLNNTLHEAYRVQALALDDDYVFVAGQWRDNVAILHRASGRVAWTPPEHIRTHGAPVCYRAEAHTTADVPGTLVRRALTRTPAPAWVQTLPDWRPPRTPTYVWYEWKAVAIERTTHTLLFLGEDALLVVPAYAARLRGEAAPAPYLYLLPDVGAAADKTMGLAACDGRVAVLWRTLTLLDLQPCAREADDAAAPFVVYDYIPHADDAFAGCEGVAMDATSIYAVMNDAAPAPAAAEEAPARVRRVAGFHFAP